MSDVEPTARVLVVDDNFAVAESLKLFLDSAGFDVIALVGSLKSAHEAVTAGGFDVAVLDIRLGNEVVTTAAERLCDLGIPIVFLSGYADADILPESLRRHPRLGKPFDPVALVAALRGVTG